MISSGPGFPAASRRKGLASYAVVQIAVVSIGAALGACTLIANQRWLDRHFLPGFFVSRQLYVFVESVIRLTVFVEVENVKALFAEYVAVGVAFSQRLQKEAWGGHDFIVRDPDGNMICFAGRSTIALKSSGWYLDERKLR